MQSSAITERMQELMLAQWEELLRLRIAVLETSDGEAIHDLRVASRRFRAILGLYKPWLPQKGTAELNKNIRKLTRLLGGLRNIDEALNFFCGHRTETDTGGQVEALVAAKRPKELARISKALAKIDSHRLDFIVQKSVFRLGNKLSGDTKLPNLTTYFSKACHSLFKPINKLQLKTASRKHQEMLHPLRIAIKKWRYFFEIAGPVLESDVTSILGQLKEYQTILGRLNDVSEFAIICD
jgi:CHAD domain-containing protein